MNELALFAGAGGGLLGSRLLGWRTVCYVEKNPYCVQVLKARIRDGYLDDSPIWDDVRTFDGRPWAGTVDVISAGFPCQPFSGAGKRLGELDERNLWPDTIRIIRQIRPRFALLENVARLVSNPYFGRIISDLAESGYDARWDCIPASAIGANHERDRLWIVAHTQSERGGKLSVRSRQPRQSTFDTDRDDQEVSDANRDGCRQWKDQHIIIPQRQAAANIGETSQDANANSGGCQEPEDEREGQTSLLIRPNAGGCNGITWWDVEPELGRVAHGVAHRVDRLAAIGNGQVPAVVRAAWLLLSQFER